MRWYLLPVVTVLLIGIPGCRPVVPPTSSTTEQTDDYHSSHGLAAHRPESFAAAVEQLATRYEALATTPSDNSAANATVALQELKDIARWLPELAGDSDLRRTDWEQVQRLALDLQQRIEPWQSAKDATHPAARPYYEKIVSELRQLAEKSVNPIPGQ